MQLMTMYYLYTLLIATSSAFTGLELMTDQYPRETSWELRTPAGTLIDSRNAGYYTNLSSKYMDPFPDLEPDQQYVFEIMDQAGDGICCNYGHGYYNIWVNDTIIYYGNGDFGSSATTTFNVTDLYCQWTIGNNMLDLRSFPSSDTTIIGIDENNSSLVFAYTPCRNGLVCNSVDTMANLVYIAELDCQSYLAVWNDDANSVNPSYDSDNKVWEFIYQNGEPCNNQLPSEFFVYWYCDDSIPEFKVISAGLLAPCLYKLEIASSVACTGQNNNANNNVYGENEMDDDKNITQQKETENKFDQKQKEYSVNNSVPL
eukprot:141521_1